MSTQQLDRPSATDYSHPLDPLSGEEIIRAVAALKEGPARAETFRFVQVCLREPAARPFGSHHP